MAGKIFKSFCGGASRFFKNIVRFADRVMKDNIGVYAAQASFFIVFSVTPFIMLLITLAKYFLPIDIEQILTEIYRHVPSEIASLASALLMEVYDSSGGLISVTAVSTLWLASKGIMALYLGLNNVFRPEKERSYIFARFISIVYTLLFIIALLFTIGVFGFGGYITERFAGTLVVPIISRLMRFKTILFMALLTLIFASFYKFLPQRINSFRRQLPGAALAAAGWIVFSHIYSIYIERFSNYSYVYGSLTAIIFLMLWLYVCMNMFLFGAEFNMLREEDFFERLRQKNGADTGKQ